MGVPGGGGNSPLSGGVSFANRSVQPRPRGIVLCQGSFIFWSISTFFNFKSTK
jgi:hypothetical protein